MLIDVADLDVIFLSYDEPNADENWADLKSKVPWATRVHGIDGSDAAHRAAGEASNTERFILVDGDNKVKENFFNLQLDLTAVSRNATLRWRGLNNINGLMYGNGGLSCWTKDFVANMNSHENADPNDKASLVEFCYGGNHGEYLALNGCFSTTYNNKTQYQAWRAGFREGVKMCLDRGDKYNIETLQEQAVARNLDHLVVWMNVGADVDNGIWAMLGARQGCEMTMCSEWDWVQVRDFKYLKSFWEENLQKHQDDKDFAHQKCKDLGEKIKYKLQLTIIDMPSEQSKFFKDFFVKKQSGDVMELDNGRQ